MKRIAIISLLAVFLLTNYAYATITTEELSQAMEKAQQGELTQAEAEELFVAIVSSVDWEAVLDGDLSSLETLQPNQATTCLLLLFISVFSIFVGWTDVMFATGVFTGLLFLSLC